ncbi:hypothetical protein AGR1C_Cc10920 [Agrobacterium fabacearum TT111]|nr:hypothetical protein AGR1C_Cc10920 [Agrobacterium fabacearum TT111]
MNVKYYPHARAEDETGKESATWTEEFL